MEWKQETIMPSTSEGCSDSSRICKLTQLIFITIARDVPTHSCNVPTLSVASPAHPPTSTYLD